MEPVLDLEGMQPVVGETKREPIRILITGETSVGKSSLANLLARDAVFEVNSKWGGDVCTKVTCTYAPGNTKYEITDTPGLMHATQSSREEAISGIVEALRACENGIDVILIVMRTSGFTETTLRSLHAICFILGDECLKNVVIASTYAGDLVDNVKAFDQALADDAKRNNVFEKIYGKFKRRIVPIENPGKVAPDRIEIASQQRKESLSLLEKQIEKVVSAKTPFKPKREGHEYNAAQLKGTAGRDHIRRPRNTESVENKFAKELLSY